MSSKILEIEEKTIDVAIEKACRDFGVTREKLNIEIISEGSTGFLGLGAKKAKIRASLLSFEMDFALNPTVAPSKVETKSHEKVHARPFTPTPEVRNETRVQSSRPQIRRSEKPDKKPDYKANSRHEADVRPDTRPAKSTPADRTPPVQPSRPETPVESKPTDALANAPQPAKIQDISAVAAVEATTPAALKARELLAGILSRMTFACEVKAMETDDTIILSITGDESGLLIGRRGQNLDALQYILNKAVNKTETDRKLIVVDSEDYRKRRHESLLSMAERIRDKVKKTQKPLSLAHMNAHDRRIIHLALQEDESLVTKSRGEGEFRKVIVLPAKRTNAGGNPRAKSRQ